MNKEITKSITQQVQKVRDRLMAQAIVEEREAEKESRYLVIGIVKSGIEEEEVTLKAKTAGCQTEEQLKLITKEMLRDTKDVIQIDMWNIDEEMMEEIREMAKQEEDE